jgi:tRNA threonylcarbamoyladenosine biosynthesis protein TsaB
MVLAVETSTAVCGVSLVENGVVLLDRWFEATHMHAERLTVLIGESLSHHHLQASQLDGIAVSIGPGSFTGLRIGLSTAKGVAFACNLPLIAVPTLKALAMTAVVFGPARTDVYILPMIDARRDEVYGACYRVEGNNLVEIVSPCAFSIADSGRLISMDKPVILVGDGVEKFVHYHRVDTESPGDRYILPASEKRKCSASTVGILGERMLQEGIVADLGDTEPLYVKEFTTTFKPQQHKAEI